MMLIAAQGHELRIFWNAHKASLALLGVGPSRDRILAATWTNEFLEEQ